MSSIITSKKLKPISILVDHKRVLCSYVVFLSKKITMMTTMMMKQKI